MVSRARQPWLPCVLVLWACGSNASVDTDIAATEQEAQNEVVETDAAPLSIDAAQEVGDDDTRDGPSPDVSDAFEPGDTSEVLDVVQRQDDVSRGKPEHGEGDATSTADALASDVSTPQAEDASSSACPGYASPQVTGQLPPSIKEASGLAQSGADEDVLWVHNDSGDQARLYAIMTNGERLATVTLAECYAYDWEDMARGPCSADNPDASCLYVGDIGDNQSARQYLKIHRIPEPQLSLGDHTIAKDDYDTMTIVYPDGPRDCEALVVDEHGHIYLLTKEWNDTIFRLYGSPFLPGAELVPMQFLSEHDISDVGGTVGLVTAASYSSALKRLLVRTYGAAFEYQLEEGDSLAELAWLTPYNVPAATEGQGEAIAYGSDGYWHVSEGTVPPVWFIECQ